MFSADEIRCHLARLEREQTERDAENREMDEDEIHYESPARAAERGEKKGSAKKRHLAALQNVPRADSADDEQARLEAGNPHMRDAPRHVGVEELHRDSCRGRNARLPPAGVCIHEFASTIQNAESEAPAATIAVANRCTGRGTLSQPNIMMPRKPASSMKAIAPSYNSSKPKPARTSGPSGSTSRSSICSKCRTRSCRGSPIAWASNS